MWIYIYLNALSLAVCRSKQASSFAFDYDDVAFLPCCLQPALPACKKVLHTYVSTALTPPQQQQRQRQRQQ